MTPKPTIREVAKKAAVSVATVSRVLNNLGGYTNETKEHVMKAVTSLGYHPNSIARNLKLQCSNTIAFVLSQAETGFYIPILASLEKAASASGYQVLICHINSDSSDLRKRLSALLQGQVGGLVVCSPQPGNTLDQLLMESGLPCVLISTIPTLYPIPYVRVDDFEAAYAQAEYLIHQGHKKISVLAGAKEDLIAGMPRVNGYRQAFLDHGLILNENLIFHANYSFHSARLTARSLLKRKEEFTAVLCASDDMAVAVLCEAYAQKLSVPNDLSVIGYDDVLAAEMAIPPLTTVAQPFDEMGRAAFEMLYSQIETGLAPKSRILPFKIIERDTVKAIL